MLSLTKNLCTFSRRTVRFLFALVAAWLFVSCLVATSYVCFISYQAFELTETSWVCPDGTLLQCVGFSLVCLIPLLWRGNRGRASLRVERYLPTLRRILILLSGILAICWVFLLQSPPISDAHSVQTAASDLMRGKTYKFQPGEYLAVYPHQSSLVLVHCLLQRLSADTTLPFRIMNVLCYMAILYFLGELAMEFGMGVSGCFAATCIGAAFLPLMLYVTFVYGNIPGLCFAMAGLLQSIRFSRDAKWRRAFLVFLFLFLSVWFKPNYQIFVVGLFLYALHNALQGKKHCWALPVLFLLSWQLAKEVPITILESWSGCSLRNGASPISWVAMGLRSDSPCGPGWYDEYNLISYFTANMNPKAQRDIALDCISGILQGFLMDPKSMVRFFAEKNASQWSDPLFQSLYVNTLIYETMPTPTPQWVESFLYAQGPNWLNAGMNFLQTLVYGGLVLWAWLPARQTQDPREELCAVILLGGFVFHSFWEAKSQFTLPYFVLILPLALLGYQRLAELRWEPNTQALWHSMSGKVRFLMPILLMITALLLSLFLAPALDGTLAQLLQTLPQ